MFWLQLDLNSFCGDVVLDSFNMANKDEDIILDNIYEEKIYWNLYYENLKWTVVN